MPGDFRPDGTRVVPVLHLDIPLQQVNNREVRRRLAIGHRGALQHPPLPRAVGVHELIHQARLAHPGFADHADHLTVASLGLGQRLPQHLQLRLPPNKTSQAPGHCGLQTAAQVRHPGELEHLHRLCYALDWYGPERGHPHQTLDQPQRRGGQANRPGRGQLLHARRQMRRLPHRRVVHVQVIPNGAHHHFPGVEPDPQAHLDAMGTAYRFRVRMHGRLHAQGGVAGPQSVVFMGQWRAEQGHEAIAQNLVHGALEAMHGLHHGVQRRVQEAAGRLRGRGL